jgi:hypothetical protein
MAADHGFLERIQTSRGAMRCYKLASELIMLPLAALVSPHRTWHDQVDVVSYAAKFMGLSETGGRGGVGVI